MKWREQLALLLGAASPFAFADNQAIAAPEEPRLSDNPPRVDRDAWVYVDPADRQRLLWFAGHRSHSSHSSHSSHYSGSSGHSSHTSHASHYSGSTGHSSHYSGSGSYVAPSAIPAPAPASPTSTLYTAPASAPPSAASTSAAGATSTRPTKTDTRDFIQRMQISLIVQGYDPGPADGVLSAPTKAALKKFQAAHSLPATGYMDVETLRRLGVLN